jgi:hypothetical protein
MSERYTNFEDFWLFYLREHRDPLNRTLHLVGTGAALATLATAAVTMQPWLVPAAFVAGYGAAWVGHFVVEKNRPATFQYPLWSLRGDLRMFGLAVTGQLAPHLERAYAPTEAVAN